jgi:serine/threonine protein kinase
VQTVDPYGLVGQVLDGQFRVEAAVGEGGFSVVYKGRHIGLDEPIAIKCLKLQAQLGTAIVDTFVRRFRDESKIQYRLSQGSLNIVRTIAAGTTMAPATSALVPYMVLEWLEGYTLSAQLRARRERGEHGRPIAEVFKELDSVAEAMAFAHSLGVVHRDLNPSNIFAAVQPGGGFRFKVMDFGVAKVVSDHALALGPRANTFGSIRLFTPAYGAPEQFTDSLGTVGPWTDVYAFALLIVELLADKPPIQGEHLGDFLDIATNKDARPTPRAMGVTIGDAVEEVLTRALDVDPKQRPGDIGELWGVLKNASMRDGDAARRVSSVPTPPPGATMTKKGTVIMPEQLAAAAGQASQAMQSRKFGGTLPLSKQAQEVLNGPSTVRIPPAASHVVVRNAPDSKIDAHGPTFEGANAAPGASPLSTTVGPSGQKIDPSVQAAVAEHFRQVLGSSALPPQPAPLAPQPPQTADNPAFAMHQYAAPMNTSPELSRRPVAPPLAPTQRSFPILPVVIVVGLLLAGALTIVAIKLLLLSIHRSLR